jgi:hypothetical protein
MAPFLFPGFWKGREYPKMMGRKCLMTFCFDPLKIGLWRRISGDWRMGLHLFDWFHGGLKGSL